MKQSFIGTAVALVLGFSTIGSAGAQEKASAAACFDALKKLAGDWVVVGKDGKPTQEIKSTFKVTAGGSAVQETISPGTDHEMITVYYLDGNELVLTHYCILGNQPHMKAAPETTPNRLVFRFAGGSNVQADKDSHIHDGLLEILDEQHLKSEWTRCDAGKPCGKYSFDLVRKQK